MCTTVIADNVTFELDAGLGAYRVQVIQKDVCEVEVIITQANLQRAIQNAFAAMEAKDNRPVNLVAFK